MKLKYVAMRLLTSAALLISAAAPAAQIILIPNMLVGQYNVSAGSNVINEQFGTVSASGVPMSSIRTALLTFDLGSYYDLSRTDLFSNGSGTFTLSGAESIFYDGFGNYYANGGQALTGGSFAPDAGNDAGLLTARSFGIGSQQKFRYLSLSVENGGMGTNLNEVRLFDRADVAPAVPEPSTWAMLIIGFGVVGGSMRRRRRAQRAALA